MVGTAFSLVNPARTPTVPASKATRAHAAGPAAATASPLVALAGRYDLDGTVTGFRPLSEGLMNRNWRITTTAGDWFLKHYLDAGPRQIAFQHQVTAALAEAGLPVPTPLRARSGGTLVTAKGRHFALYPWVAGRHRRGLALPLEGCAALGRLLGRLHSELGRILPPVQQPLLVPTASVARTLARIDELLGLVRAQPSPDGFDELAERRLLERRGLLVELAGLRPPEAEALLVGYVHGDFHALNLLCMPTRTGAGSRWRSWTGTGWGCGPTPASWSAPRPCCSATTTSGVWILRGWGCSWTPTARWSAGWGPPRSARRCTGCGGSVCATSGCWGGATSAATGAATTCLRARRRWLRGGPATASWSWTPSPHRRRPATGCTRTILG